MKPTFESQFLTPAKLAWVLDVSERTVGNWLSERWIPHVKIGGQLVRIDPQAAAQFILTHTRLGRIQPAAHLEPAPLTAEQFEQLCRRMERFIECQVMARKEAA